MGYSLWSRKRAEHDLVPEQQHNIREKAEEFNLYFTPDLLR